MSLGITYRKNLYDMIIAAEKNSKVTLTPALRREIFDLYIDKVMKPLMTPQETIEFIELYPKNVNHPPRPLRRFNEAERKERKKKSAALNKLQRDYCIDQADTVSFYKLHDMPKGKERWLERESQQLYIVPDPSATKEQREKIEQHNMKVAFLFNKDENWSKYTEGQNKEFARLRTEIILQRLKDEYEIIKKLPKLLDENLPAEELAKNYRKLMNACNLYCEIEIFRRDESSDFYAYTEEEKKLLNETYVPLIADATNYQNKALMMANPAYEYLDIAGLDDYNFDSAEKGISQYIGFFRQGADEEIPDNIKKFYRKMEAKGKVNHSDKMAELEKEAQEEFFARHSKSKEDEAEKQADAPAKQQAANAKKKKKIFTPAETFAMAKFFKELNKFKLPNHLKDPVTDFMVDYEFYFPNSQYKIQDKILDIKNTYGMTTGAEWYSERVMKDGFEYTKDENWNRLYEGIPVAIEKNDRVIILTPDHSNGPSASEGSPESLYNYSLKEQFRTYTRSLKDADPLLLKSSPEYKEMQKALAEAGKLEELQPGQSTAKAYLKFQKLLNSTEIYLRHKEDGVMDDDDRSSIELRRVKAAREVKKFALAKLKELELTNQARLTLQKYNGMDQEAIKAACEAEDALAKELKQRAEADKAARNAQAEQEKAPLDWFEKQMSTRSRSTSLPKTFQEAFKAQLKQLKGELVPDTDEESDNFYENFSTYQKKLPTQLAHTLGGMIAAELIEQERKDYDLGTPGPLETFFSRSDGNSSENSPLYQALQFLGKDALKKIIPDKDFDHLEDVTLSEREVKHLLANFHPSEFVTPGAANDFAREHVYAIPAEIFEKDYSTLAPAGLDQTIKDSLSGFYLNKPDETDAIRLLAGALVASEMIDKERKLLSSDKIGPVETALIADGRDGLKKLGDKVIPLCSNMKDSNDVMSAFYLMDPSKLADQLAVDFRGEHGLSSSLEESLREQYCTSIKPLRGKALDDYEQVLVGYANMSILEPLQKYDPNPEVISAEDSRAILSSCALCSMVIMERAKGNGQPGMMESLLLKDPEQFETIRQNIEKSADFNNLISPALTPNGIPVSSFSYMTKLLKDTGLVVNIIDNTKEAIKQKKPVPEKGVDKNQEKTKSKQKEAQPKTKAAVKA